MTDEIDDNLQTLRQILHERGIGQAAALRSKGWPSNVSINSEAVSIAYAATDLTARQKQDLSLLEAPHRSQLPFNFQPPVEGADVAPVVKSAEPAGARPQGFFARMFSALRLRAD